MELLNPLYDTHIIESKWSDVAIYRLTFVRMCVNPKVTCVTSAHVGESKGHLLFQVLHESYYIPMMDLNLYMSMKCDQTVLMDLNYTDNDSTETTITIVINNHYRECAS